MNELCFVAMKETYHTKENGSYTSYAICVEGLTPKGRINILTVPDVSCDKNFAYCLAEQCTRFHLSPLHLFDVILDALP